MKPVVIVGAGLAGLTCARTLKRNRVPFIIIEAADRIGGRLRTETDVFPLDAGAQYYYPAFPTAREELDEDKLQLQNFQAGVQIVWDGERHHVNSDRPLQMALSGFLSLSDKLRLARWTSDVQWLDHDDIVDLPDRTTEQYLREQGFTTEFIDRFARPFFGSQFLDRSLATSCRHAVFIWKSYTEGNMSAPSLGMGEIPKQIGSTFGRDVLRLNARVVEVLRNEGSICGVKLDTGETIEASAVVLACDAPVAQALSGVTIPVEMKRGVTLYFSAPEPPTENGWLVINGNMRGISDHAVTLPSGAVSVTVLGDPSESHEQLAEIVKSEMRLWFPQTGVETWKLLRGFSFAQMTQPSGFKAVDHVAPPGLYLAGEFTADASVDGAIRSGVECAEAVLQSLTASVA